MIPKSFFTILLFGLLSQAAAMASPITYDINFTVNVIPGQPNWDIGPSSGSFTFDADNATDPFTDFTVVWNGVTFDLTTAANNTNNPNGLGLGCDSQSVWPQLGANILFQSFTAPCTNVSYDWFGSYNTTLSMQQFAFRVSTTEQNQISQEMGIDNPDGVSLCGEGTYSVSHVPEPAPAVQVGIGLVAAAWLMGKISWRKAF